VFVRAVTVFVRGGQFSIPVFSPQSDNGGIIEAA
jgi:hypothetical protein